MRRMKLIFGLILILSATAPAAQAEQTQADQKTKALVDAMLGVDPRQRNTSGEGAMLDAAYGPGQRARKNEEELPPDEWTDVSVRYGADFQGLRSPLFDDPDAPQKEDLNSNTVLAIPLGRPEEREGVMYEDSEPRR